MNRFFRLLALLGALAAPLRGHDFWIEPSLARAKVGDEVLLRFRVGEEFVGESMPRLGAARIAHFAVHGPPGRLEIAGGEGDEPAGRWRPGAEGLYAIAYESRGWYHELAPEPFAAYLAEEGLDEAARERVASGEQGRRARERFTRHGKALIAVGGTDGEDRPLGLELELVAEHNPFRLAPGARLGVRLLHGGRPLAGARLVARSWARRRQPEILRTDAEGRAEIRLDVGGPWLLKAVHMVREDGDPRAEWHSLWASLTFALPER